jgi:indole-3-glycerol phosphate synthase
MFLKEIIRSKREEIKRRKSARSLSDFKAKIRDLPAPRGFRMALHQPASVRLITEIKKASPSKGLLRERFDPMEIAKAYESNGAVALSVLTDEPFFQGSLMLLTEIQKVSRLPLLQKDFILDEFQLYEARACGADAVLLITAVLEPSQVMEYQSLAGEVGLDALVEVHTHKEVEQALAAEARIIGINNRNLETFETDLNVTFSLIKEIPEDRLVVSESAIGTPAEVERLMEAGVDALLVGESLLRAKDIGAKMKELMGH